MSGLSHFSNVQHRRSRSHVHRISAQTCVISSVHGGFEFHYLYPRGGRKAVWTSSGLYRYLCIVSCAIIGRILITNLLYSQDSYKSVRLHIDIAISITPIYNTRRNSNSFKIYYMKFYSADTKRDFWLIFALCGKLHHLYT